MAKGAGNTIIVAGGGGAAGKGGGAAGGNGERKPKDKGPLGGGKFKLDDNTFNMVLMALAGVGVVAYVYTSRPDLVHEFVGTLTGQKPQQTIPASPTGTVQTDVQPQASTNLPYQFGALPDYSQQQQQMQYPYPQQSTGQQPFQYPQQSPNLQQYQPYQPSQYGGGGGGMSTSFNPTFGQNSDGQTYSFAARRRTKLDFDSSDGLLMAV